MLLYLAYAAENSKSDGLKSWLSRMVANMNRCIFPLWMIYLTKITSPFCFICKPGVLTMPPRNFSTIAAAQLWIPCTVYPGTDQTADTTRMSIVQSVQESTCLTTPEKITDRTPFSDLAVSGHVIFQLPICWITHSILPIAWWEETAGLLDSTMTYIRSPDDVTRM